MYNKTNIHGVSKIFNTELYSKTYKELFGEITTFNTQNIVFTPNPEILLKTLEDDEFQDLLNKASYLTIDGIGMYVAFQIQDFFKNTTSIVKRGLGGVIMLPYFFFNLFFRRNMLYKKYGERICGSDLTTDLVNYAEKENIKITIIDPYYPKDLAKVKSQRTFREKISTKFPKLDFDFFVYKPEDKNSIIEKIKNSDSKILFATLGMKKQEQAVVKIMDKCYNIKLGLGIGSSFDYFTGFQKRAPKFWRAIGFEWLYRLATGPQKMLD
ncbi:MAG: WecB/TagA/CpsF family glycosyltransferase [Candidatus Gracilibacteria bacterium]|nr:WecB/TagA/CpsF family glycosyltransferase [Candidatus Gracilibacteria bacterium]